MLCKQQIGKFIRHCGPQIAIAVAILFVSATVANATSLYWNSTNADWSASSSWTTGGGPHNPPTASDTAYVGNGTIATVTTSDVAGDAYIGQGVSHAGNATLNISAGGLTISGLGGNLYIGNSTYTGTVNLSGGALSVATATNINNLGTLSVSGSGSYSSPTTNVASGGSFNVSGASGGYHLPSGKTLVGSGGTVTGPFTADAGAYIGNGSSIGALHTVGNIVLNGTYNWKLGAESVVNPGTDWNVIQMASGNLSGTQLWP